MNPSQPSGSICASRRHAIAGMIASMNPGTFLNLALFSVLALAGVLATRRHFLAAVLVVILGFALVSLCLPAVQANSHQRQNYKPVPP